MCFRHVVAHAGGRSSVECIVIDDLLVSVSSNSGHEPDKIASRVYTLAFLKSIKLRSMGFSESQVSGSGPRHAWLLIGMSKDSLFSTGEGLVKMQICPI